MFRDQVMERVISFVAAECYEADPEFDYTWIRRRLRGPSGSWSPLGRRTC